MSKGGIKKVLKIIGIFLLVVFAVALSIWFTLRTFRHEWSAYYLEQSRETTDINQKIILICKAQALTPTSYAPYFELGKIAYENKNFKQAEKYFRKALYFNNKDINNYTYLANILVSQEKYGQAQEIINQGELIDANNPEFIFIKARISLNQQKYSEAHSYLEKIKDKSPLYETYSLILELFLNLEQNKHLSAKIEEIKSEDTKALFIEFLQSENPIFKQALIAYWWLWLGEEKPGCALAKKIKDQNTEEWAKLLKYQELFKQCNL